MMHGQPSIKICSSALSTTNSKFTGLEMNPRLLDERLVTNRLSYVCLASIRNGQVHSPASLPLPVTHVPMWERNYFC